MTKKILSVVIAVVMVLSLVPMSVFAKTIEGPSTRSVDASYYYPVDTINTDKYYLIGLDVNGTIYLVMNYCDSSSKPSSGTNYYCADQNYDYHGYLAEAIFDTNNNIVGCSGWASTLENCAWKFVEQESGKYAIQSTQNSSYYLSFYNYNSSSTDCYPSYNSSNGAAWEWDANAHTLSQTNSGVTKYLEYLPTCKTFNNFYQARPLDAATNSITVKLYEAYIAPTHTVTVEHYYKGELKGTDTITGPEGSVHAINLLSAYDNYNYLYSIDYAYGLDGLNITIPAVDDAVATVTYADNEDKYNLTVNYINEYGAEAAPAHVEMLVAGAPYSVVSPTVEGFIADIELVEGTMPAQGLTVLVTYYDNSKTFAEVAAVVAPGLTFTNDDATYPWIAYVDPNNAQHRHVISSGNAAKKSSTSTLTLTVPAQVGDRLAFDYFCESESASYDYGTFKVNGVQKGANMGGLNQTWGHTLYTVEATDIVEGNVTFTWAYTKDSSVDSGADRFLLDNVVFYTPDYKHVVVNCINYITDVTFDTLTYNYEEGESFNIAFPDKTPAYSLNDGNTPIEGVMSGEEMVFNVYYTPLNTFTVTINYVVPAGYTAPDPYVNTQVFDGQTITVDSPVIEGLIPDRASVTVTVNGADVTETVTYHAPLTLAQAIGLDNSYTFVNDAYYPWTPVETAYLGHENYAQCGNKGINGTTSSLELTVPAVPGQTISFDYFCASEGASYDYGAFYINGERQFKVGGSSSAWVSKTYTLSETQAASGTVTYKWTYTKDDSLSSGYDALLVDNLVITDPVTHTVTINCELENGDTLGVVTHTVPEGTGYDFDYPEFEGYRPIAGNPVLEGTMSTGNVEYTVVYEPIPTHTLTITYVVDDAGFTGTVPPAYTHDYLEGEHYSVSAPAIYGYTPDVDPVAGDMGAQNVEVTVTYSRTTTIDEVLNVGDAQLIFTNNDANYPWLVITDSGVTGHENYATCGNHGVASSTSTLTLNLTGISAGDVLSFDHYVSSENAAKWDFGSLLINGVLATYTEDGATKNATFGGPNTTDWSTFKYVFKESDLTEGAVTVAWKYQKDGSGVGGDDIFKLDNVRVYTPEYRCVTVNCVLLDTSTVICSMDFSVEIGEQFTILLTDLNDPSLADYRPVEGSTDITGVMGDIDMTFDVVFEAIPAHKLTITYTCNGTELAPTVELNVVEGRDYSVTSPSFDNYIASTDVVSGNMGDADISVEVTYTSLPGHAEAITVPVGAAGWFFYHTGSMSNSFQSSNGGLSSGWNSSANVDDWACSPVVTLPDVGASLSFSVWTGSTYDEYYEIWISTAEIDSNTALGEAVAANGTTFIKVKDIAQAPKNAETVNVDLSQYSGQSIQYIFHHCGDDTHESIDQYYIYFGSIKLLGELNKPSVIATDVQIRSLTSDDIKKDLRFVYYVNYNDSYMMYNGDRYGSDGDNASRINSFWAILTYEYNSNTYNTRIDVSRLFYNNDHYVEFTVVLTNVPATFTSDISCQAYMKYSQVGASETTTESLGNPVIGNITTANPDNAN